jgi:hypothetical protein
MKHTYWYTIADDDADPPRRWPITVPHEYDLQDQNDIRDLSETITDRWECEVDAPAKVLLYTSETGPLIATVTVEPVTTVSYHAGRVVMWFDEREASE